MVQAQLAADALARHFPEHEFVLTPMTTHADRDQSMRLTEGSREGVFVKELEQALLEGRAELAVHSAKDLPTLPAPPLTIAAFLPRADARDALIARQPALLSSLLRWVRRARDAGMSAEQIRALVAVVLDEDVAGEAGPERSDGVA